MAPLFRYMDHGEIPDSKELFVTKLDDKDFGEGEGLGLQPIISNVNSPTRMVQIGTLKVNFQIDAFIIPPV